METTKEEIKYPENLSLKEKINNAGLSVTFVAEKIGVSRVYLGVIPKVAASFFAKWPHLSLQSVHSISPESVHSADFKAF